MVYRVPLFFLKLASIIRQLNFFGFSITLNQSVLILLSPSLHFEDVTARSKENNKSAVVKLLFGYFASLNFSQLLEVNFVFHCGIR